MDRGYTGYIKSKSQVLFSEAEVADIVAAIKTGMLTKELENKARARSNTQSTILEHHGMPEVRGAGSH